MVDSVNWEHGRKDAKAGKPMDPRLKDDPEYKAGWESVSYSDLSAGTADAATVAAFLLKSGEVRTTSSTGGQKGVKPERYDLLPVEALDIMARLYGFGAEKYAAHNWRKGYDWSKSYASLMRHATRFWAGEDLDPETGLPHLAGAAFHCFTLMVFMQEHPDFDDRFKREITDTSEKLNEAIATVTDHKVTDEGLEISFKLNEGVELDAISGSILASLVKRPMLFGLKRDITEADEAAWVEYEKLNPWQELDEDARIMMYDAFMRGRTSLPEPITEFHNVWIGSRTENMFPGYAFRDRKNAESFVNGEKKRRPQGLIEIRSVRFDDGEDDVEEEK